MPWVIRLVLFCTLIVSFIGWIICNFWFFSPVLPPPPSHDACTQIVTLPHIGAGFTVKKSSEGKPEYIGVSDGSFIFDATRTNKVQKCQGALQFRQQSKDALNRAGESWTEAVVLQDKIGFQQEESNDAEALIYRENSHVLSSGLPFITFIVGTILTGDDKQIGYDALQGAYVAQEEFNRTHDDRHSMPLQIRLLIANFSSNVIETPDLGKTVEDDVTRMIIAMAAKQDQNVKGVLLALPYTFDNTITLLDQNKIPVILSGAFSNSQIQATRYIFPVAASTRREGQVGAWYAQQLQATNIAVFVNNNSSYSKDLVDSFQNTIGSENIVAREIYNQRDKTSLNNGVSDALKKNTRFIYFAGDSKDADTVLGVLQQKRANIKFMGADALYELGNYTGQHYNSLYFTSFAYPDEWNNQALQLQHPFPSLYRLLFSGWPLGNVYGYLRPDNDALLSYDALAVLLQANETVFSSQHNNGFTFDDVRIALMNIKNQQAFTGFSGRISFGDDIDNKPVVILHVNEAGLTQMIATCTTATCQ